MSLVLSLCTGVGGLETGVEWALPRQDDPTTVGWFSEIDEAVAGFYTTWIEPTAVPLGDLRLIDWAVIPPACRDDLILTAGYPCQPFSQAGRKLGEQDPRHLWPEVFRAIRTLRPRLVVLENVRGHLRQGFDAVLGDLASIGFDAEWSIVRASDVGACHQRARIFCLAWPGAAEDPNVTDRGERWDPASG